MTGSDRTVERRQLLQGVAGASVGLVGGCGESRNADRPTTQPTGRSETATETPTEQPTATETPTDRRITGDQPVVWTLSESPGPAVGVGVVGRQVVAAVGDRLYGLDRSGTRTWRRKLSGEAAVFVSGGEAAYVSVETRLVALTPETGEARWTVELPGELYRPFTIRNETLYVTDGDRVTAVSTNGTVLWTEEPRLSEDSFLLQPIAVTDSRAYLTGDRYGGVAARTLNGWDRLWTVDCNGATRPVFHDGSVYVGTDDGVTAIDTADGSTQWELAIGSTSRLLAGVVDGQLYLTKTDGTMVAVDTESRTVTWRADVRQPSFETVAVSENTLYVGHGPTLDAISRSDGQRLWRVTAQSPVSTVGLTESLVLVGTDEGAIHGIER